MDIVAVNDELTVLRMQTLFGSGGYPVVPIELEFVIP